MTEQPCSAEFLLQFEHFLQQEEKSPATIEKYLRDVRSFCAFLSGRPLYKDETIAYKEHLTRHYAPASVNSMLVALNGFLRFAGRQDCTVRLLKIQRQIFSREDKELHIAEYRRLVGAAGNARLSLVIQTICCTGIRVSELQYITVQAVQDGKAVVSCKNKTRIIFIPSFLRNLLKAYIKRAGIKAGCVFVSKNGKPLDRCLIWRGMKALCARAQVSPGKVFPHAAAIPFYTCCSIPIDTSPISGRIG